MVNLGVFCPIQQGNHVFIASSHDAPGGRLCLGIRIQFSPIQHGELLEVFRPMPKPYPKPGAGGEFLHPSVQVRLVPGNTPRPQAIHQQTRPVAFLKIVINPFDLQRHINAHLT